MNILIGVYGTSDKTDIKITTQEDQVLGLSEVEEVNIYLSTKHAWDAINRGIMQILSGTDIALEDKKYRIKIGLGLKATELIESCIAFKKSAPTYISDIKLQSDDYVLCSAAHGDNGTIIVLDEGVAGNSIVNGKHSRVGGWGFPHSDCGSFPWIGMEAIRLTLQWIDGYIEPTPLLKAIHAYFDNNTNRLVHWAMHNRTMPGEYKAICAIVLEFWELNDKIAVKIIQKTIKETGKIYQQLLLNNNKTAMPVCLYGYLAPYIQKTVPADIERNLVTPKQAPVDGALTLIN